MVNLQLLDVIKETIPGFDPGNPSDIIKAEKVLKAHQKSDDALLLNDIENFIGFFRENGNKYGRLFSDENLIRILKKEYFKIDSSRNRIFSEPPAIQEDFGNDFSESIKDYIQANIKNHNWENLRIFYKNYFPVINFENKDLLLDILTNKNNLVRATLPYKEQYDYFLNQYRHAIDPHFYALQSDIDSHYFNEEILDINNDLSQYQYTDTYYMVHLGKIFIALARFDAYTENLRETLAKNSRIGASWAGKESQFATKPRTSVPKKYIEKDHGNTAEWILISIFYTIVFVCLYFLYQRGVGIFCLVIGAELVVFLAANRSLNKQFEEQSESKKDISFRRKAKKFGFKLVMLQFYIAIIGACLAILGGVIALGIASGGVGFGGIIILVWIIRAFVKNKK
ncbi:hypothetical protein HNP38_000473 [Chryseobacterium defluvii]|uniref:Uncharacterized protein n=1 Tax=Chryseobacterium defluvii TaxID=160396 RepID=A0A840K6R0_9FLAO|nr:hypothetical protein [Chryseobacterium defluvii]MBB4805201.1 hypothetical protein [Chryseobacterium defluvii]